LEALFFRSLRDAEVARDLAQETLLKAWSKRESYDPTRPLRHWVFQIGVNLLRNHLRRKTLERATLPSLAADPANRETPTKRLAKREKESELEEAISLLPEGQREVVLMRYQEELSCKAIGEILGITPNAVSIRLHHARRALRDLLGDA